MGAGAVADHILHRRLRPGRRQSLRRGPRPADGAATHPLQVSSSTPWPP